MAKYVTVLLECIHHKVYSGCTICNVTGFEKKWSNQIGNTSIHIIFRSSQGSPHNGESVPCEVVRGYSMITLWRNYCIGIPLSSNTNCNLYILNAKMSNSTAKDAIWSFLVCINSLKIDKLVTFRIYTHFQASLYTIRPNLISNPFIRILEQGVTSTACGNHDIYNWVWYEAYKLMQQNW